MHEIALILGSNIHPERNLVLALELLRRYSKVSRCSSIWETEAVGSAGPDFWNQTVCVRTSFEPEALKWQVLRVIEEQLGRVRSADKNAPRTIDIDIIIVDGEVYDNNLWSRAFIAVPTAELFPDLIHPASGMPLEQIAHQLSQAARVSRQRPADSDSA